MSRLTRPPPLPLSLHHGSMLAEDAIKAAVKDFKSKKAKTVASTTAAAAVATATTPAA